METKPIVSISVDDDKAAIVQDDGRRRSKKPLRFIDEEEAAERKKQRSTSEGGGPKLSPSSVSKKQQRKRAKTVNGAEEMSGKRKRRSDAALSEEAEAALDAAEEKPLEVAAAPVAEPRRRAKVKMADTSVEEADGGSIYCSVCGCAALLISLQGKVDICKTCYTAFIGSLRSASQESELECDCGCCAKCRALAVLKSGIDLSGYSVAKGFPSWVSRYGERQTAAEAESAEQVKKAVKMKKPAGEASQRMGSLYDSVSRGQLRQCVQAVSGDSGTVSVDVPQEMSSREEAWRDGVAVFGKKGSLPDLEQAQCLLCGSGGAEQDLMLRCSCCTEQFHLYCLSVCERPLWSGLTPWRCARCLVCRVCKRSGTACRSCIKCGAAFHPACLAESRGYTAKDWQLCCDCAVCKHCGKAFSEGWSDWDNLCQHCESTEVKCHECHRLTSLIGNSLACSTANCKNVVHATCAGINDELYHVYLVNEQLDFFCRDCDSRGFHALKAACERDFRARIRALSESLGLPSRPQQLDSVPDDLDETAADKIFCRLPPYQEFSSAHDLVKAIIIELIEACKSSKNLADCALLSASLEKGVDALFSWLHLQDIRSEVLGELPSCPELADSDSLSCSMAGDCRELSVRKLREASAVDGAAPCELCGERRQDGVLGRLLPSARTSWIHAGCAIFSPEIRVDENDCALGVRAAVRRARGNRCSDCGKTGASIDCLSLTCPQVCHLGCAVASGWQFSDLCESRCPDCAAEEFAGNDLATEDFGRLLCQRLVVGAADQSLCEVALPPEEISVRIGGLLIGRLGSVKPESGSLGTVLLPVGFRARRQFWSVRQAGQLCEYEWRLQAEAGRVRFVLSSREDSLRLCASHPVTVMRRLCQMVVECWAQQTPTKCLALHPGNGWSSVGIAHPRIVWCAEQLGFCPGYSPKYLIHRWAQLRKQQTAENPSGCARSEAFQSSRSIAGSAGNSQLKRTFSFLLSSARRPVTVDQQQQQQAEEAAVASGQMMRNQLRAARNEHWQCRVQVLPSGIHGLGLFAVRPFAKSDFIVEYTGELIRASLSEAKEKFYQSRNIDCYLFKLNWQWVIDASVKGGPARFVNHSCSPNCVTRVMDQRILIVAGRDIAAGEELTYDYRFDKEEDKVACLCGSFSCRKFLN